MSLIAGVLTYCHIMEYLKTTHQRFPVAPGTEVTAGKMHFLLRNHLKDTRDTLLIQHNLMYHRKKRSIISYTSL